MDDFTCRGVLWLCSGYKKFQFFRCFRYSNACGDSCLKIFTVILGIVLILVVLWETFETIVLPRRVTRQFRLTRFFYRATWAPWIWLVALRRHKKQTDFLLSY